MEENNNILVKVLAIVLIAILGLNVYRTETTKKEMEQLATKVEQLSAQLDSYGVVEAPAVTSPVASGVSKKEFTTLSKLVSSLELKVSALQGTVDRLARSQSKMGSSSRVSESTSSVLSTSAGSSASTAKSTASIGRVSVSAKVKVENRYVQGPTYLPKVTTGPAGVVVIDVTMDRVGIVSAASLNSKSTIPDEEIVDLCKESALKTNFSYNPDAPDKLKGSITYTFVAK